MSDRPTFPTGLEPYPDFWRGRALARRDAAETAKSDTERLRHLAIAGQYEREAEALTTKGAL